MTFLAFNTHSVYPHQLPPLIIWDFQISMEQRMDDFCSVLCRTASGPSACLPWEEPGSCLTPSCCHSDLLSQPPQGSLWTMGLAGPQGFTRRMFPLRPNLNLLMSLWVTRMPQNTIAEVWPSSQDVTTSANKGTQGLTQLSKLLVFSFMGQNIAGGSAGSDLQQRSGTRIQFALLHVLYAIPNNNCCYFLAFPNSSNQENCVYW